MPPLTRSPERTPRVEHRPGTDHRRPAHGQSACLSGSSEVLHVTQGGDQEGLAVLQARLLVTCLALAAHPISFAVEIVRVGRPDREVLCADVSAVQIRRRRRDAEVRVGRVAVLRWRSGGRRSGSAGRGRGRPRPPSRGRGRLSGRRPPGGCSRSQGHQRGDDRGHRHGADLLFLSDVSHEGAEQEPGHSQHPALAPPRRPAPWRLLWWWCAPAARRLLSPAAGGRDWFGRPVHPHPPGCVPPSAYLLNGTMPAKMRYAGILPARRRATAGLEVDPRPSTPCRSVPSSLLRSTVSSG
jgi:hypothetical protein